MTKKCIAIVGAGPAGLMAAEVLSQFDYEIHIYEHKPSAARKFLMAGKTGLNISHAEQLTQFIGRYDQPEWLAPWIHNCDAKWIRQWMQGLGIESYVGSSGRIFPLEMKAAPLLRAWLKRLAEHQVQFHYRHRVEHLDGKILTILDIKQQAQQQKAFDAIILACGAVSWPQLGSDGAWQQWLQADELNAFQASNAGVCHVWSSYMQPLFGQPLKRVAAWVDGAEKSVGDIVLSHYGLESGLIYKQNRALRQQLLATGQMILKLDLLPELTEIELVQKLQSSKKQSTANLWRKIGIDQTKAGLIRELVAKKDWNNPSVLAGHIKQLTVHLDGFRAIDEAISCAGGVKQSALTNDLQLKQHPAVFCCGEMLDWDAPTGGYLLTACFATGRAAAQAVHKMVFN